MSPASTVRESWLRRVWTAIAEWLHGPRRTGFNPELSAPVRPDHIDAAAVVSNKKLVKRGIRDGQQEMPPSQSQGLGEVETEIYSFIEARREEWNAYIQYWASRGTEALQQLIGRMLGGNYSTLAEIATTQGIANLQRQREAAELKLNELQSNVRGEYENCARLQHLMNIKGAPKNIPSVALHWVFLMFIGFTEAVLNGTFLGLRSAGGLIEGLSVASGIALINMTLGFALGRWTWVYLRHWAWWVKALNAFVLMAIISLIIVINLAVAHYRDILDEGLRETGNNWLTATRGALTRFINEPLGVQDLMSWGLAGIGCLCAILAIIGSHLMVDPYPKYGAASKALTRARTQLDVWKRGHLNKLQEIFDDTMEKLRDLAQMAANPAAVYQQIQSFENRLQELKAQDMQSREMLQQVGEHLLSTYRNANMANRETDPPQHWKVSFRLNKGRPIFEPPTLVEPPNSPANAELSIDDHVKALMTAHQEVLKALQSDTDTAFEPWSQREQNG